MTIYEIQKINNNNEKIHIYRYLLIKNEICVKNLMYGKY